jgi:hypothetical protein
MRSIKAHSEFTKEDKDAHFTPFHCSAGPSLSDKIKRDVEVIKIRREEIRSCI